MFYITSQGKNLSILKSKAGVVASLPGIDLQDNYYYLRNWTVSAFEKWGLNGNADGFTDNELAKSYKTFHDPDNGNSSMVCLNHVAYSRNDSMGENLHPKYVPEKYIELIMAIDRDRERYIRPDLERDIKSGRVTDTSMGCMAEFSVCTVCGNIAYEEHDRCEHLDNKYGSRKGDMVTSSLGNHVLCGELYFNVDFVENSIIDDGAGADMNAKIFEIAAHKEGKKVATKDSVYYAVKQLKRTHGNLKIFKKIEDAIDRKN